MEFSPFLARFSFLFKNNLVIRISSTPILRKFYLLLNRGVLLSSFRLIDLLRNFHQAHDFQEKWKKNFLLKNFTKIIKFLIKILAPQFFSTFKHSHTRDSTKLSHLYSHGIPSRKFHSGEIQYIQSRRIPRIVKRIPIKRLLKVARVIVKPRNVLKGEHNPTNLHSLATLDFHFHCQRHPSIQKRFYRWPTGLSSGISIRHRFNFFPFAPRFTQTVNRVIRSRSTRLFDFLISCYAQEIFLPWCFFPFVVSPPLPRWYSWGFAGGRASYREGLQERKIRNLLVRRVVI